MREYAPSIEQGNNDVLHVHLYPGSDGQFTLIEDDGTSNAYLEGIFAKTKMKLTNGEASATLHIDPAKGYYDQMKEKRNWVFHIHNTPGIESITINDQKINFHKNGKVNTTEQFKNNKYKPTEVRIKYAL